MNPFEITDAIGGELPEMQEALERDSVFGDAVRVMQIVADYSKKMLSMHELTKVMKCMRLIGKIYDHGNKAVKSAVESVYVFSFFSMQSVCSRPEWNIVRTRMPIMRSTLYVRQLYSRGI